MLIRDEAKQLDHGFLEAAEEKRAGVEAWVKNELANAIFLNDPYDPTNAAARWGRAMSSDEVEKRIKKLVPDAKFHVNPRNLSKKYMTVENRGTVLVYENGRIPERSIMSRVLKETMDPSILRKGKFHIERADLPKHEVVPHVVTANGDVFHEGLGHTIWDPSRPIPGMIRTEIPWSEAIRGWRTMLAKLVKDGLTTPAAAEREFGSDNTPEWAGAMGKRDKSRPW